MSERLTPRNRYGARLSGLIRRERDAMPLQHSHDVETATIFVYDADDQHATYMACFGRPVDEPWETTEERWDAFAKRMWAAGVEPIRDEPFFTIVEDETIWDHYVLHEIEDE